MKNIKERKKFANNWFIFLQSQICRQFEDLEKNVRKKSKLFIKREWKKENINEGGGTAFLLKNGKIFDKVGVNQSTVSGQFKKEFRNKIYGTQKNGEYWASGISVVAHMKNPKIPALHFNTRFIVTSKCWFGGGMDVTPSYKDDREKNFVHKELEQVCRRDNKSYKKYKKWCEKYFYLPHHHEQRGIGGIFFDYEKKNWEKDFRFIRNLGLGFIDISKKIITHKEKVKWNHKEKEKQLLKRGRYIEFNLLYDRGTKFGLNSGGDISSILMSLPPEAKWK